MFDLSVRNKYGQVLSLTRNTNYTIVSIEGLDPADASVNFTRNAGGDGSSYNSAYVDNKVIIINLAIESPVEDNRINLYKYFKNKYPVRLFYKNGSRDVYIDGYCKTTHIGFFDKKQIAQITIECPDPFFIGRDNQMIEFSNVEKLFEFPFSIIEPIPFSEIVSDYEKSLLNYGDIEVGFEIHLKANSSVTNPGLLNTETGEYMKISFIIDSGEEIYINTKTDEKTIKYVSNGVSNDILQYMIQGSSWLTLTPGDNLFMVTADFGADNLEAYCIINDKYEGV